MNTTTSAPASFAAAAHMAGMNNQNLADLAAASHRASTTTPNYDSTHDRINETARAIAEQALELSGGRSTYSWEGNGIRLTYTGDTVDDQGDPAFGPTVREYLVGDVYKTTSPTPSQSGTGLMNLALDHVRDCTDPVVEAKRQIAWLLLDPSLDLVEYTIRTSTAWHGLMQTPHKLRTALAIRLAEVIEQKVLENPGGGLDIKDIAEGTNVVGYMVKTLDGSIFNLMKRIITNESKHRTTLDTPVEDGDAYRRPAAELATEQLPQSAESDAILGADDARALSMLAAMQEEHEAVAKARAEEVKVRARRVQEKQAMVSRTFFAQTGLPLPIIPALQAREQMMSELAEEQKLAELGNEDRLALSSFLAWHNLLRGESDERDADVSDVWLSIWASYSADDTETMLNYVGGNRGERLRKIVEGVLSVPEKMSAAAKLRVRNAMKRRVDDPALNDLVAAAVTKYDVLRRGLDLGEWDAAAGAVVAHPASTVKTVTALVNAFDEALFSLGLD